MDQFNKELKKAGALLSLDGLHPLTTGARLAFAAGTVSVTKGPSVDAKEVVGGYWLLQAAGRRWMKRCPAQTGDAIEIQEVLSEIPLTFRRQRKCS